MSVCPHLMCVTMDLTSQDNIGALVRLKALTELTLRTDVEPNEAFFYQQLEPVLRTVGPNLRRLVLSLQYLDLATISRLCPALIELEVEDPWNVTITDQLYAQPSLSFLQLQRLKFFPARMNTVTPEQLFQLLSGCNQLLCARLGFVKLTDALLQELVGSGALSHLRKLELHAVRYLSTVGIRSLVLADNELASLKIIGCEGVIWADMVDLSDDVADNNMDVVIKYGVMQGPSVPVSP